MQIETKFELFPWQRQVVDAWVRGDRGQPFRGTLEIFTGGGKTLIALACWAEVSHRRPGTKLAVVVPTEALARQWRESIAAHTNVPIGRVGLLGAGSEDSFQGHDALVAVINTAAKRLPQLARGVQPLMLVIDESHRAGAPTFQRVLDTPAEFRIGLSATPDREELDEEGEPIEYDEHILGQRLGEVIYRFSLADARNAAWLPEYEIHHHGVKLHPTEQREYDSLSRRIDDLGERITALGGESSRARAFAGSRGELGDAARSYVGLTAQRKDVLYRAAERHRVVLEIVHAARRRKEDPRILLFHERVAEAEQLYRALRAEIGKQVGLEHSRLPDRERARTLEGFRSGAITVLVSVKSLIEGIDVPAADVGISVAATSSVRQRIQSLGRVLRRPFEEGARKEAEMHVLYVADTVDEFIYAREDWADLTGEAANHYWIWPLEPGTDPGSRPDPPRTPRPTEEQEWERLGHRAPDRPERWLGSLPDREYSVDTRGTVSTGSGAIVRNPQGVDRMVQAVRERPGGRFYVTPAHRLVIVWSAGSSPIPMVAGQLAEPFALVEPRLGNGAIPDPEDLKPGDPYPGPLDKDGGEFALRQRRGGMVVKHGRGRNVDGALTEGTGDEVREQNARRVLDAWRSVASEGMPFTVNGVGHAWFLDAGEPRFLAAVPGGFVWPDDVDDKREE